MENQTPDAVIYLPLYRNIVIKQANHKLVFSWTYGLFSLLLLLYLLLNEKSLFEFLILLFVLCVSTAFALVMYRLYVKSKQMIYAPADRVVNEAVAYFDLRDFERLHEHLKTMDFSTLQDVKVEPSGNIRLDVFVSIDKRFVAAQLFQFIPYRYKAVTPIYHYHGEVAAQFLKYININQCKIKSYRREPDGND